MERRLLADTIAVLEAHREAVGDDVVLLAVSVLQEKMASLESLPTTQVLEQTAVLVADLSGFTAMSEIMDAEEVRDMINAVWQKLDSVIQGWGGHIDKHVGDGVIALFGVPNSREDDAERAVQAALDMQLELSMFNERALHLAATLSNRGMRPPDLRMRIGIMAGPVFMGKLGTSAVYTAVGETVTAAMELEEMAPIGGILVAQEVYGLVRDHFDVEILDPVQLPGQLAAEPVYVVRREKPQAYHVSGLGAEGISARLVGRTDEMAQLQTVLQTVINTGSLQLVTILGDVGVGKSRLLYGFEQWLKMEPDRTAVFSGRVHYDVGHFPFQLIRDAFANYLEIFPRSSAAVAREKLVNGLLAAFGEDNARTREQVHFIGHLLGFDFSHSSYVHGLLHTPQRIREFAFRDMAVFFKALTHTYGAVVVLLEDVHWADEGSLDLIEYLLQECQDLPLLLVVSARPDLWQKRPSWQWLDALYTQHTTQIDLQPLNGIDSRLLVAELLQPLQSRQQRLVDLVVDGTDGRPLFIEATIKLLIDAGMVVRSPGRWQVDHAQRPVLPKPTQLADVLQQQLNSLTDTERHVLGMAAVIGRVFWESAVVELAQVVGQHMGQHVGLHVDRPLSLTSILQALDGLETKLFVYRRRTSLLAGVAEYVFRHDQLQQVAYAGIAPEMVAQLHAQAATWYATNLQRDGYDFSLVIAEQHARAGNARQASTWYGRAGALAVSQHALDTAVRCYGEAMTWLEQLDAPADSQELVEERLAMYAGLGSTLRHQARFEDATRAYTQMFALAEQIAAYKEAHRAAIGLFLCYDFQGENQQAMDYARQAVTMARRAGDVGQEAMALAAMGWSYAWMNQLDEAIAHAEAAMELSTDVLAMQSIAYAQMVLGHVYRVSRHFQEATQYLERGLTLLRELGDRVWEGLAMIQLGHVARDHHDYDLAQQRYAQGLRIARDLGDQYGAMLALQNLGRLCQLRESYETADTHLRQAVLLAEKSGNLVYLADTAQQLGDLHLGQYLAADSLMDDIEQMTHWEQAAAWYQRAAEMASALPDRRAPVAAKLGLARLDLAAGRPRDAVPQVLAVLEQIPIIAARRQHAHLMTRLHVIAWRLLGSVAAELPPDDLPVVVGERPYLPTECFQRSLDILSDVVMKFEHERALTLRTWATFEIYEGDKERGKQMWYEALAIFSALGMVRDVEWMNSFAY